MELTTRKTQSELVTKEQPHYYEVRISNHPNGVPQVHCGKEEYAIEMLQRYPGSTYEKIYLPHPPQTVDVPHVAMAPDLELPMQQILPESDLQPVEV